MPPIHPRTPASMNSLHDVLELLSQHQMEVLVAIVLLILPWVVRALLPRPSRRAPWLDPTAFKHIRLAAKEWLNHNTLKLRFALETPDQRLGLPIGQHISFLAKDSSGQDVYRSYTPVSDDDLLGSVVFVIKIYPNGKMSQILKQLEVGDSIQMKGPKGKLQYKPNMKKSIGMLAGGTGITPMYQVVNAILKNPADKTKVSIIFGNLTEQDILLRGELDDLVAQHPGRIKVYHVLNNAPSDWKMGTGFITADMIKQHLPPPGPETMVLRCGPPGMMDAMKKHLDALGYEEKSQFMF